MARVLGTWQCFLLPVWIIAILHIQRARTEVRIPCGMVNDWFPSVVKPQSSRPPYELNVTRPDGRSVYEDMYRNEPRYEPYRETYTSEGHVIFVCPFVCLFCFVLFCFVFLSFFPIFPKIKIISHQIKNRP